MGYAKPDANLRDTLRGAKRRSEVHWPSRFLSDPGMLAFWKRLKTNFENSADMDQTDLTTRAARDVFAHLINHAQSMPGNSSEILQAAQIKIG
ncbi:MAG: hypothetical protein AAF559_13260 [Pseudomonadota bacterium]